MPSPGDKGNDRIFLTTMVLRLSGSPLRVSPAFCRAAGLFCESRSQRIEFKIFNLLPWIDTIGANICANKWGQESVAQNQMFLPGLFRPRLSMRIFDAGIHLTVHKAFCSRVRLQDARYLSSA